MSLYAGALLGEPRGGATFLGIQKDVGSRAHRMDITLCGGPAGEFVRGLSAGDLRRPWRQASFSTGALLRIMGGVHSPGTLRDS